MKGYVQCYTGSGKGKTTAAIGLAIRAAGWEKRSIIIQFLKGKKTGELNALHRFNDLITFEQHGTKQFYIPGKNDRLYKALTIKAYKRCMQVFGDSSFDIIICDEIITALAMNLLTVDDIIILIQAKAPTQELILTGCNLPRKLYPYCDLISEVKEIKHYYNDGIKARKGIEW